MKHVVVNPHFPDVHDRIWGEEALYEFMKKMNLLGISENDKLLVIKTWNEAIAQYIIGSQTKD